MDTLLTLFGSNLVVGIFSYITGRRRMSAETDNQTLRNLELSINLYKQIIDDLKGEIESLNLKIQELEKKVDTLHKENKQLKSKSSI